MLTESPLYRNPIAESVRAAYAHALSEIRHEGIHSPRIFEEAFKYMSYWATEFVLEPSISGRQALPVYAALDAAYDVTLLPEEFPACKESCANREEFLDAKVRFVEWTRLRFSNLCDAAFDPMEEERYFRRVLDSFLTACLAELG